MAKLVKDELNLKKFKDLRIIPECPHRRDGMCYVSENFIHKCDCPTCALLGTDRCVKVRNYGNPKCET